MNLNYLYLVGTFATQGIHLVTNQQNIVLIITVTTKVIIEPNISFKPKYRKM